MIDLSKDEDIVVSEAEASAADELLGEAVMEEETPSATAPQAQAGDGTDIDEDELLAQLASLDEDDGLDGLGGFGDIAADDDDKHDKKKQP